MKVSEQFKSTIKAYLDNMAAVDSLFAPVYQKPTKNIDNCITYILNQVKKSGCCGFSDDEIFGMALHYYQEDNIEVGSPLKCNVVVNHHVELSEEEKKTARTGDKCHIISRFPPIFYKICLVYIKTIFFPYILKTLFPYCYFFHSIPPIQL